MIKNIFNYLSCLGLLIFLSSCASNKFIVSDVTRHHSIMNNFRGSFVIEPAKNNDRTLAFLSYAEMVSAQLENIGLTSLVSNDQKPDYIITLDWEIEGPSPDFKSRDSSFFYSFGYGGPYNNLGYGVGYPYTGLSKTKQLYVRRVNLVIYKSNKGLIDGADRIFESTAVSTGSKSQINPVMPFIIAAIFNEFPGDSGSTKSIKLTIPEDLDAFSSDSTKSRLSQ